MRGFAWCLSLFRERMRFTVVVVIGWTMKRMFPLARSFGHSSSIVGVASPGVFLLLLLIFQLNLFRLFLRDGVSLVLRSCSCLSSAFFDQ